MFFLVMLQQQHKEILGQLFVTREGTHFHAIMWLRLKDQQQQCLYERHRHQQVTLIALRIGMSLKHQQNVPHILRYFVCEDNILRDTAIKLAQTVK